MLELRAGNWWGWSEQTVRVPGWGASPIFLRSLQPLGTGRNELRLRFVEVLQPRRPAGRDLVLRIQLHRPELIVGTYRDETGATRVATIARCDADWLDTACSRLMEARAPMWPLAGRGGSWTIEQHLGQLFGSTEAEIVSGLLAAIGHAVPPTPPRQVATLPFNVTLSPWDSRLVSMGFRPRSTDDRWWISLDGNALLVRRSWTGFLIFRAATEWSGDRLRIGTIEVNRDPMQYKGDSDEDDLELFRSTLRSHLLGVFNLWRL